jgi:hypothetical protein
MTFQSLRLPALAVAMALPVLSGAQPAAVLPEPATGPAPLRVAPPQSAMAEYRRWQPDEPGPGWRAANDEMRRLGGHAGHIGRRSDAGRNAQDSAAPARPPMSNPHGSHGGAPR